MNQAGPSTHEDPAQLRKHIEKVHQCLEHNKLKHVAVAFYLKKARGIPLRVDPFMDLERCAFAGIPWGLTGDGGRDNDYTDEERATFQRILTVIPCYEAIFNACSDIPALFEPFIKQIAISAQNSRNDDASSVKSAVLGYISSPEVIARSFNLPITWQIKDPAIPRGWHDGRTALQLIPLRHRDEFWRKSEKIMAAVLDKSVKIDENEWPSFLYPDDTDFIEDKQYKNLFRGPILLRTYRHIFTSPSSAFDKDVKAGKRSQAELHGILEVEPEGIAYAAVLARQGLVGNGWKPKDFSFNYQKFYHNIVRMFKRDPKLKWVVDTLKWWNRQVCLNRSRKARNGASDDDSESGNDDPVDRLYAQMEAATDESDADDSNINKLEGGLNGTTQEAQVEEPTKSNKERPAQHHGATYEDQHYEEDSVAPRIGAQSDVNLNPGDEAEDIEDDDRIGPMAGYHADEEDDDMYVDDRQEEGHFTTKHGSSHLTNKKLHAHEERAISSPPPKVIALATPEAKSSNNAPPRTGPQAAAPKTRTTPIQHHQSSPMPQNQHAITSPATYVNDPRGHSLPPALKRKEKHRTHHQQLPSLLPGRTPEVIVQSKAVHAASQMPTQVSVASEGSMAPPSSTSGSRAAAPTKNAAHIHVPGMPNPTARPTTSTQAAASAPIGPSRDHGKSAPAKHHLITIPPSRPALSAATNLEPRPKVVSNAIVSQSPVSDSTKHPKRKHEGPDSTSCRHHRHHHMVIESESEDESSALSDLPADLLSDHPIRTGRQESRPTPASGTSTTKGSHTTTVKMEPSSKHKESKKSKKESRSKPPKAQVIRRSTRLVQGVDHA